MSETPSEPPYDKIGIVVIGRNEGERLRTCLRSVIGLSASLVYVDSASSDGSIELAQSLGVDTAALDPALGLSAARARNLGLEYLTARDSELEFVQFVDGDCELLPTWLAHARATMYAHPSRVVVAGVLLERHPEASPYNRLCGLEWQRAPGAVTACGGLFFAKVAELQAVGGFRGDVVAGEEGELCVRLRRKGGVIWQSADVMAWHDTAMFRLGQWWQRAKRGGFAYAQGANLHGSGPERHGAKECRRILFWGGLLPAVSLALAWPTDGWSLLLLLAYPLQFLRVMAYGKSCGWSSPDARLYAFFTLLDKFPGLQGLVLFHWRRLRGRAMPIIEHKDPSPHR